MLKSKAALLVCLLVLTPAIAGWAQEPLETGTTQWGLWGGYSPSSPSLIGVSPDRRLFTLNLQYARVLAAPDWGAVKFTAEAVPVALVHRPAQALPAPSPARTTYGAGVTPVGFQFNFGKHRVQPFLLANGGLLYFTEQVPVLGSSQFNFTFSFGGGLELFTGGNKSLMFGYRFHHISNAYTADLNPGIDSNLVFLGFMWKRR